jgi:hypothetical protein
MWLECLGGNLEVESESVARLLLRAKPDRDPARVALYACPECGDLGCGAVFASVVRSGDLIEWQNFAWERAKNPGDIGAQTLAIGPFHFDPVVRTLAFFALRRRTDLVPTLHPYLTANRSSVCARPYPPETSAH